MSHISIYRLNGSEDCEELVAKIETDMELPIKEIADVIKQSGISITSIRRGDVMEHELL